MNQMHSCQGMPGDQLDHMAMHGEPLEALPDGSKGAVPMGTVQELADNLRQFTDSVQQKASSVVSWQNALESMTNERAQKYLGCISANLVFEFDHHCPSMSAAICVNLNQSTCVGSPQPFPLQVHGRLQGDLGQVGDVLRVPRRVYPHRGLAPEASGRAAGRVIGRFAMLLVL